MVKFNFSSFLTPKHEMKTHDVSEDFNTIKINTLDADISIFPSDDDSCKVICYENNKRSHTVSVSDGTLTVDCIDGRKWYDYIGINSGNTLLSIYLPKQEYASLYIKSQTGDVGIPAELSFVDIDVSVTTGDVKCYASVANAISIKASTGDIELENLSAKDISLRVSTGEIEVDSVSCEESFNVTVRTGRTELEDVRCKMLTTEGTTGKLFLSDVIASESISIKRDTGDVTLEACDAENLIIKTDTGDVTLTACDAENLIIKTDTGDVNGTLLSDKIFFAKTNTGKTDVPKTTKGGTCEVTTATGDIKFGIVSK